MKPGPPTEDDGAGPTLTSPLELVLLAGGVAIAVWLLVRAGYGELPAVPEYAGSVLYVLAAVEAWLAWYVRTRVAGGEVGLGGNRLHPIAVARVLVLAKASALLGACATGLWVGLLVYLVPREGDLVAARADVPGTVIGLIGGLALVIAALVLERCCRTPDDPEDEVADGSMA